MEAAMKRREFLASAAALTFTGKGTAQQPFPVSYRRVHPYEALYRHALPGADEFKGEKAAIELEQKLARMFQGKEALAPELEGWKGRLKEVEAARFYVLPGERIRFEIKTKTKAGLRYDVGVWQMPGFRVVEEQAVTAARPLFRDITGHVFGQSESFGKQLVTGVPGWCARLDAAAGIDVYGNQGIAVGDVDGDGVDEIYVCQPAGLPNRLYKIRAGVAEDLTERSGLGILDETTSALFLDLRNSGKQDVILLQSGGPALFLNQGGGVYKEREGAFRFRTKPQGSFTGMAAADYDRDGRLDVYLCCYVYFQSEDQYQFPTPYHDARNGPPNFLFQNRLTAEGGSFEDVTEEVGLNENNDRFSFAPAWCDYDGDGWPDLYVANDFGRNNLYRNRGGKFRDEAAKAEVEDIGPGMSASWFDYDGDGRADLYISNMWSSAGQRVVKDGAFHPAAGNEEAYRRHTKGNSLYRNRGDGGFEETGAKEGVEQGRWAWSSGGFDFDLDGVAEIVVTTGMLTNRGTDDLNSFFWRQTVAKTPGSQKTSVEYENGWSAINQLIRQDWSWCGREPNVMFKRKNGRYEDWSGVSGLDFADDSRTFAVMDVDGDGYPDIVLKSRLGPQVRVLQNDCAVGKPVIGIGLRGTKSNRDGIGAKVVVNGQAQWLAAGSGFLSQHSKWLYFGLGGKERAEVTITWPSGLEQRLKGLEAGHRYEVVEGAEELKKVAFGGRKALAERPVTGRNEPEAGDCWLMEPVPLPEKRKGPGFVLLYAGKRPALAGVDAVDLGKAAEDIGASYALLRRYLFEYRSELKLPMLMLIDGEGRVRKVYGSLPGEGVMRADVGKVERSREFALPFAGRYLVEPRRNYFKLGAAFYWAGYPERALPYLEEVVRRRPDNWKAMLAIGRIEQESERFREALATYERVLEVKPEYGPALVSAGEAAAKSGDGDRARKYFEKALGIDGKDADALNQMGLLSARANDYEGAREWFQRAITAQRDHAGAINNLGVLYAKTGKMNDAVAAFRYGLEAAPDDETLYLNLGRLYVSLGERERAKEVLGRLLERKPESGIARKALAELEGR